MHPARERPEALLHHVVVIAVPRIGRDGAAAVAAHPRVGFEGVLVRRVVGCHRNDGPRLGPQRRRRGAAVGAGGEPAHVAVVAPGNVFREVLARAAAERGLGKADGVEPEVERPVSDRVARCVGVHRAQPRPR